MKVSLSELEQFLANPEGWAESKLSSSAGARMSYAHVTRMAIYRFHQKRDKTAGSAALTRYLDSFHLVNADKRALAEQQLSNYIAWVGQSHPVVLSVQSRMRVELGSGIFTSGEIHRVDLDLQSDGYRAVLLGTPIHSSRDPRASILQLGYADFAKRDPGLIRPAWQNLDGTGLTEVHVGPKRRREVLAALRDASLAAAGVLARARR